MTSSPVGFDDLAAAGGVELPVPGVHLRPATGGAVQGVTDGVADEGVGDRAPQPEFDDLAVEQPQLHVRAEGGVGDDRVQAGRFAGAGFASGEQVAVHQGDGHGLAVLVDPERDRVIDRQFGSGWVRRWRRRRRFIRFSGSVGAVIRGCSPCVEGGEGDADQPRWWPWCPRPSFVVISQRGSVRRSR
jgi:hypothetical protein